MSPRRTRSATLEQTISTRSKAQKVNNAIQDVVKSVQKTRQSQKKENNKDNLEITPRHKNSANTQVKVKRTTRKKDINCKVNSDKKTETEDVDQTMEFNDSLKILRGKQYDNVTVDIIKQDLLQLNAPKNVNLKKRASESVKKKTSKKTSPVIITPKITPPKLSLTPHRSKKTPKKSPISLGSPKTHTLIVSKLFISPRKLSLVATDEDSEENVEKSDNLFQAKKSRKKKKDDLNNSDNNMLSTKKKKHKKSDENLKTILRKFSKSPKIVLKSPKAKKSKSRKLNLSPSPIRKRISKTSVANPDITLKDNNGNSPKICIKKSPSPKRKRLSIKHEVNPELKNLTSSQIKDMLAEPIVVLEKLSPEKMKQKNMLMIAGNIQSNTLIKVKSPSIKKENNSNISPQKTSISPKQNSRFKLKNSNLEKVQVSAGNKSRINRSIQEKNKLCIPLMSSTPREKKSALMDTSLKSNTSLSTNNVSFDFRLRKKIKSNIQLSNSLQKNTDIENVSESSRVFDEEINNTSDTCLSTKQDAIYKNEDIEKKEENGNNTYELEEPQTLKLRRMIKKRISTDADLSSKNNSNKKAKVHFANVSADKAQKSINKLNELSSSISHNVRKKNSITNLTPKSKKIETPKLISSFKKSNPRVASETPKTQLSGIQITPKSFTSIEKKSEKKSSLKKKLPNFGKIHEQMFAKAESVVDAKKRLQARHLIFTRYKPILRSNEKVKEKKPLPNDTKDGIHNRFGFKLKKPEAVQIILKKQVFPKQKRQEEMRTMLKGVRTNRRFELQMKTRCNSNL